MNQCTFKMHILENTSYLLVSNGVVNVVRAEVRLFPQKAASLEEETGEG